MSDHDKEVLTGKKSDEEVTYNTHSNIYIDLSLY